MSGFQLQRLCQVMEPEPGNPQEVEGVLNPAAARGPDGELCLFPRLVARGNYSRIGIVRVRFDEGGLEICYSAGVIVLSKEHPRVIRYRSPAPVLKPQLPQERSGTIVRSRAVDHDVEIEA